MKIWLHFLIKPTASPHSCKLDLLRNNMLQLYHCSCCPQSLTLTAFILVSTFNIIRNEFISEEKKFDQFVTAFNLMLGSSVRFHSTSSPDFSTKALRSCLLHSCPDWSKPLPWLSLASLIHFRSRKHCFSLTPLPPDSKIAELREGL